MRANKAYLIALALLGQVATATPLVTLTVTTSQGTDRYQSDGVLQATRQSSIAAQVAGQVMQLPVKAGDRVRKGQLLLRLDDRVATQNAAASHGQLAAANAQLALAARDFQRQRQLRAEEYISQAAMDRAQAQYRAAQAQAHAQQSLAGAAGAWASNYTLSAPYAAVVAAVSVSQGDMALPGRELLTLYDARAFKVVVHLPQSILPVLRLDQPAEVSFPSMSATHLLVRKLTVFPAADPTSHTVDVRLDLPALPAGAVPGTFVRVSFVSASAQQRGVIMIPQSAVVTRSELTAVYVVAANGRPSLRQVRLARQYAHQVEVLSGLTPGERIAVNPQAAAQWRGA